MPEESRKLGNQCLHSSIRQGSGLPLVHIVKIKYLKEHRHFDCSMHNRYPYTVNQHTCNSPFQFLTELPVRGPNLFFKYFFLLFGTGLFYPLRVLTKVQIFFGSLVGPLTLLHPKMKLLPCREPRELETVFFLYFPWFYDFEIRVQSASNFPHLLNSN